MGCTVAADEAGPVEREYHRQILQRDVVNELIVGALQERRINRDHRFEPLGGESRGEGDRMLLGNRHVVVALGESLREFNEARALAHRRGDPDDGGIAFGHVAQPLAENLRVGRPGARFLEYHPARGIEWARAVPFDRIRLRGRVALAFARDDMQELGSAQFL